MKRMSFWHGLTLFTLLGLSSMFSAPAAVVAASTYSVIVDDYTAPSAWSYSRIATDRGDMGGVSNGSGSYTVAMGEGSAVATVNTAGWAGVWTSLLHRAIDNDELDPAKLLGPYIKPAYQAHLTGIEAVLLDGAGTFKIELLDKNRAVQHTQSFPLSGGPQTATFNVSPTVPLKLVNWFVAGAGHAAVDEIRLLVSTSDYTPEQAVFLFSYGHLSQCYDPASGLVRDQAHSPANEALAVQSTGMFALATAAACQLGYVEQSDAESIVKKTAAALKALPVYHGLLPHFVANGSIAPNSEWSSIDTVIALTANLLAAQYLHLDAETASLQAMLQAVDWSDLTDGYTAKVSMGYDNNKVKFTSRWDSFGSELFLIAAAFSAANPDKIIVNDEYPHPPTWDGSGFIDELAALFFPMHGTDYWGNDWNKYRCSAFSKQLTHFADKLEYVSNGLFGLSVSEVPEKWAIADASKHYGAWGVGGWGGGASDGSAVTGYPIVAPHYAAMICKEHPEPCRKMFRYLVSKHTFSPLNNTESSGIKDADLKWSSSKASWNLSMQALGAARALSENAFAPYQALRQNAFMLPSYNKLMTKQVGALCSVPIPFVYELLL